MGVIDAEAVLLLLLVLFELVGPLLRIFEDEGEVVLGMGFQVAKGRELVVEGIVLMALFY
jgi:hypothetical protein